MRIAIISDIHANLEALTACLKRIDELNPDLIISLGDLVDYGAEPNECMELLYGKVSHWVLGNHDEAQFDFSVSDGFSANALISSVKTRSLLDKKFVEFFKTFSRQVSIENCLFVHSSVFEPEKYPYILNEGSARYNFKYLKHAICFIGHSHIPVIFEEGMHEVRRVSQVNPQKKNRYIINVGSIGQPRDGNSKSAFGFFDTETFEYRNIRVEYDITSASSKIIRLGLPEELGLRLFHGK
jgi:putative phosphoesterase